MEYEAEKKVALPADTIFAIISDVNDYQHFLPWCQGSKIVERIDSTHQIGALLIGFQHLKEKLISEIIIDTENRKVTMNVPIAHEKQYQYQQSNAVKQLHAYWQLSEDASQSHTLVQFYINFTMKNKLYNQMLKLMMRDTIEHMADAFINRAEQKMLKS